MQLSIIIPTKDRSEVFDETLRYAVQAIDHFDAEIIVVNDSKLSQPLIPGEFKKVRLLNNLKMGVASARNAGAKESKGDLLLFLDDDIMISRDSVEHVLKLHQEEKKGCFNVNWEYPISLQESMRLTQFGRFMKANGMTSFRGWYADPSWRDNALFQSKSVASFHLSVSRKNFEMTKGYNEQFPHAGFEDYDFPLQLRDAGLSFYIDSRVTIFHNEEDRLKLENWLSSQERRAATRRVAVNLGYEELKLTYGLGKKILLTVVTTCSGLLLILLKSIPNFKSLDPLYFKVTAVLQAGKIYKGYTSE